MASLPVSAVTAPLQVVPQVAPAFSWGDLNPLTVLGNAAAAAFTAGWQSFMTSMWAGGLWLTQFAFKIVDAFTTPDLSQGGVMSAIYPATFAIGGALALILAFLQVGFAAWQRDGKGLARLLVGIPQFALAWGGMLGVGAALTLATAGLTQGMLQVALGAPSFGQANILTTWQPRDGVDAAVATVLGICGLFLIFAAIGYLLIMLVRAGALVLLMATSPISAAGLLSEGTRAWFWKCLRWFLAALMIAPLAALVLGIGKKLTDGVLAGAGTSTEAAVGQGVIGTVLVIISAFAPLILFRLLAFVDPGTSSGASFRASMNAAGGLSGLLGGTSGATGDSGSGAATSQASNGTSQGEADAGSATQNRLLSSMGAMGADAQSLASAGEATAGFSADVLGAAGVGHPQPYFAQGTNPNQQNNRNGQNSQNGENDSTGEGEADPIGRADATGTPDPAAGSGADGSTAALPVTPPSPPGQGSPGAGSTGSSGGSPATSGKPGTAGAGGATGGGGAGAAGGAESAAAVAAL